MSSCVDKCKNKGNFLKEILTYFYQRPMTNDRMEYNLSYQPSVVFGEEVFIIIC